MKDDFIPYWETKIKELSDNCDLMGLLEMKANRINRINYRSPGIQYQVRRIDKAITKVETEKRCNEAMTKLREQYNEDSIR